MLRQNQTIKTHKNLQELLDAEMLLENKTLVSVVLMFFFILYNNYNTICIHMYDTYFLCALKLPTKVSCLSILKTTVPFQPLDIF